MLVFLSASSLPLCFIFLPYVLFLLSLSFLSEYLPPASLAPPSLFWILLTRALAGLVDCYKLFDEDHNRGIPIKPPLHATWTYEALFILNTDNKGLTLSHSAVCIILSHSRKWKSHQIKVFSLWMLDVHAHLCTHMNSMFDFSCCLQDGFSVYKYTVHLL